MRIFLIFLLLGMCFMLTVDGDCLEDLTWKNIGQEIIGVNAVWVDSQNPQLILSGTNRGIFKTQDGGSSWQIVLFNTNKIINFLYVDQVNKNLIYAGSSNGLFFSQNQGKTWQRIYYSDSELEANCLSFIKMNQKEMYLGTEGGLFKSKDNARSWQRFSGRLGNIPVWVIGADQINKVIYLVTSEGLYRIKPQMKAKRVFIFQTVNSEYLSEDTDEEIDQEINYISIDPNRPEDIYLATNQGIFKSKDQGETWTKFSDFGLSSKKVRFVMVSINSGLWAATQSRVFIYNKKENRWQDLSPTLNIQDIKLLTIDHRADIYVAGHEGLLKGTKTITCLAKTQIFKKIDNGHFPDIAQVQQAAIKYAQVIAPEQIAAHRKLCRLKAILPDLSLNYDKTIYGSASTKVNGTYGSIITGPTDWGISLEWNLGDLIWDEQQRLIDSQARLMIKLRQDIIDEVTRLYYEHRRLQLELISLSDLKEKDRQDKELRIEELIALLNGLTGNYFSKIGLTE